MEFLHSAVPAYVAIAVFVPLFIAIVVLLLRLTDLEFSVNLRHEMQRMSNSLQRDRMTKIERKLASLEGRLDTEIAIADDIYDDLKVDLNIIEARSIGNRLYNAWQEFFS